MKKILIVILLVPSLLMAQPFRKEGANVIVESDTGEVLISARAQKPIKLCSYTGNAASTCPIQVNSSGVPIFKKQAAVVVTPKTDATPATANELSLPRSIMATAAPTAAWVFLPAATVSVGREYVLDNDSANPVAMMPQGTDTINALSANTAYSCATTKRCECDAITTGRYKCTSK